MFESESVNAGDLPPFTKKVGGAIVPRFAYLMHTVHDHSYASIRKRAEKDLGHLVSKHSMPPETLDTIARKMTERIAKKHGEGSTRNEYHALLVVEDTNEKKAYVVVCAGIVKDGKLDPNDRTSANVLHERDLDDPDELDSVNLGAMLTAKAQETRNDWNGERVKVAYEEDIRDMADLKERFERNGFGFALFSEVMPVFDVEIPEMVVAPETEEEKSAKRAALVARFGEKAVSDLEACIAARKSESGESTN